MGKTGQCALSKLSGISKVGFRKQGYTRLSINLFMHLARTLYWKGGLDMTDEYVYVNGQDGEVYEIRPTDALLKFLQRLAEGEAAEQASICITSDETELSHAGSK